jgi:DNA-binding transcriptional LysR family regulator
MNELIALAETLSFPAAAKRCYTTCSSLRRHLSEVEEDLGGKLFERTSHHVSLTQAGEVAYQSFKRICSIYEQTCIDIAMISQGTHGVIKIASPYYWTEDFTEPLVDYFSKLEPLCASQIISCQILDGMESLISGRADVFIDQRVKDCDSTMRCIPFATQRLSVVVLDNDPLAKKDEVSLEELAGREFVFLDPKPNGVEEMNKDYTALLAAHGVEVGSPHLAQQVDTLGVTLREVEGVALMPYSIRHMDRSYLRFVPLANMQNAIEMCLYYLADNTNPLLDRFVSAATSLRR